MPLQRGPLRPPSFLRTPLLFRLRAVLAAVTLAAFSVLSGAGPETGARPVSATSDRLWISSPTDPGVRLSRLDPVAGPGPATAEVDVDPTAVRQRWWGTGAALTDASEQLLRTNANAVKRLYSPTRADGARLNMLRLPLSATDFSPQPWAWAWDGVSATPPGPQLRAVRLVTGTIERLVPGLRVVGTPWTAPASMKDSGTLRGGGLAPEAVPGYGQMLLSQAGWLTAHGVPLFAMTLGNEPGYSTDYPSMTMTDAQLAELGGAVGPRLGSRGVRLWALDHNWSDRSRLDSILGAAPDAFDGAAFHCYGGSPDQMAGLPVPSLVSECTGTTDGWSSTFGWDARNLVAGPVAAGSGGLMMWNLALDDAHGPVDTGSQWGCKNCRGLVTVTSDGVRPEPEFYVLAHLSRAASPGARVLGSSATAGISAAAFLNPDGSIGVFGHNATGSTQTVRIAVAGRTDLSYTVEPGELFTFRSSAA